MSQSEAEVSTYYALPVLLEHGEYRLTISAVSLQGLEAVQPIAHFFETRKRLPLNQENCRTLILLTGSALLEDWVGVTIQVHVDRRGPVPAVRIMPAPNQRSPLHTLQIALRRFGLGPLPRILPMPPPKPRGQSLPISQLHSAYSEETEPSPSSVGNLQPKHPGDLPRRWTTLDPPVISTRIGWRTWAGPGLVIALLSMVSFLYARAYSVEILAFGEYIGYLMLGNGR